jgi:hypothetical protein
MTAATRVNATRYGRRAGGEFGLCHPGKLQDLLKPNFGIWAVQRVEAGASAG